MSLPDECISETSRAHLIGCQQFQQNQQNEQSPFLSFFVLYTQRPKLSTL
jgi:hypothetical protein